MVKIESRKTTVGRCPYCLEQALPIPSEEFLFQVAPCPSCGADHHIACAVEHGGCAACGWTDKLRFPDRTLRNRVATKPMMSESRPYPYGTVIRGTQCGTCSRTFTDDGRTSGQCFHCFVSKSDHNNNSFMWLVWLLWLPPLIYVILKIIN